MKAYAYFDRHGTLLEFVSDVSLRAGNSNVNDIYLYVEGLERNKILTGTYKDLTTDTTYSPSQIISNVVVAEAEKIFPTFEKYDPKVFVSGKKYDFVKVSIPTSNPAVLATSGSKLLTITVSQLQPGSQTETEFVMNLGLITFYVQNTTIVADPGITLPEAQALYAYIGQVVTEFNPNQYEKRPYKAAEQAYLSDPHLIYVVNQLSNAGNASNWEEGQLIEVSNANVHVVYRVVNGNYLSIFNYNGVETSTHAAQTYQTIANAEVKSNKVSAIDSENKSSTDNYPSNKAITDYVDETNNVLHPTDVVDNLTSTATNKPLSANQGKVLSDKISNIEGRGRFLSVWNGTTGKPADLPDGVEELTTRYDFKTGDWYLVGTGGNKYPTGTYLDVGTTIANFPSETKTTASSPNDTIIYSGNGQWTLVHTPLEQVAFETIIGSPYDNNNLGGALNSKQNQVHYGSEPVSSQDGDIWVSESTVNSITYTAGSGINILNGAISVDNTVALKTDIPHLYKHSFKLNGGALSLEYIYVITPSNTPVGTDVNSVINYIRSYLSFSTYQGNLDIGQIMRVQAGVPGISNNKIYYCGYDGDITELTITQITEETITQYN